MPCTRMNTNANDDGIIPAADSVAVDPPHPRPEFRPAMFCPPSAEQPITIHQRQPGKDSRVPLHHHPWAQLVYPTQGSMRVAAVGTSWIVPAFRAVWIPPLIDHTVDMLGHVELCTLYIASEAAPLSMERCSVVEVSPLLQHLIAALKQSERDRRYQLMTELALEEMRRAPPLSLGLPLPKDRRLQSLCAALMADPADNRSLRAWSKEVGASERTLTRLFQEEMATSFSAWRQQVRLARAVDELGRGHALSEVAQRAGYATPAAFAAMFKRALGLSPGRFAREPRQ